MDIDATLHQLSCDPQASFDVAEVALTLAQDEYPDLDVEAYLGELAGMAHEARPYLGGNLKAQVTGLCRYLFHEMGFRGNQREYHDPRNSYLNQVLDRHTGIPITLSILAMAVGSRGLDVVGIGLPGHFVVKVVAGPREVLFDPFHGGRLLQMADCDVLVEQITGMPFQATLAHLEPVALGPLVRRLLSNLKAIYQREGDFPRAIRLIERLRQLNPHDPLQLRDLGVCWLRDGHPGNAIDHLTAYLAASPPVADAKDIRKLLDQARGAVARWN